GAGGRGRTGGGAGGLGSSGGRGVPGGVLGPAHSFPPCASTIERLIDRPRPRPSRLVVKNGSKSRPAASGGTPVPVSLTVTSAPLADRAQRIVTSRAPSRPPAAAPKALRTTLGSTLAICPP